MAELEKFLPDAVSEYAYAANALRPALACLGTVAAIPASAAPTAKAQFVVLKLPDGMRADIRILDANGRELKVIADSSGDNPKLEPGSYKADQRRKERQPSWRG